MSAWLPIGSLTILAGLGSVLVAIAAGLRWPGRAAWLAAGAAATLSAALAIAWARGTSTLVDVRWLSPLGSHVHLGLDALASPLAVFATVIATVVLIYTAGYLPAHLAEHDRPVQEQGRFCALILVFMVTMLVLLVAHDLIVLFAALELTAITSFLLIQFDKDDPKARSAATGALLVTAGSSILFLTGVLLVAGEHGTTRLDQLELSMPAGGTSSLAATLIVLGVIGKSAQVPLHFWLPRAMVAPTPVSAYLHSAAMVAAGVFVLMRLRFVLAAGTETVDLLTIIGFASILVGGVLALVSDELKRILAYSTVAQYGYVAVLIGLGGDKGSAGAPLVIVAHGLCKCALFMTAGAVTQATGIDRLSRAGGLARSMPVLAGASLVAAAGLAGLPLTIGYFKDEVLFGAAQTHGPAISVLAAVAVALSLAYTARFWFGLFAGPPRQPGHASPGPLLVAPVVVLAALVVLGGIWVSPLVDAFAGAGSIVAGHRIAFGLGYHFDLRAENLMAVSAWVAGFALFATRSHWQQSIGRASRSAAHWLGPAAWANRLARAARRSSHAVHRLELRDLRDRLGAVVVPVVALVWLAAATQTELPPMPTMPTGADMPEILAMCAASIAALVTIRPSEHLTQILLLSFVGFSLALVFALAGAVEVALIVVLVETILTILFITLLSHIRPRLLEQARRGGSHPVRAGLYGVLAGATASLVALYALSNSTSSHVVPAQIALTESAHSGDVVTAILADFRGLDTVVEATVFVVAIAGAAGIAWSRNHG